MTVSSEPRVARAKAVGVAVWLGLLGVIALAILADQDGAAESGDWVYFAIVGAVSALVWWLVVVRSVARPGNTPAKVALIAGIVGAAAVIVWWTGLPFTLGAGAVLLGLEGRSRAMQGAGRARMALAGTILGAVLVAGWIVIAITDIVAEI